MLLYRPLITAFRDTTQRGIRDYLVRELKAPRLHAEPAEVLEAFRANPEQGLDPTRLDAEIELRERLLCLKLTSCDPDRRMGGLWTAVAAGRSLVDWTRDRDRVLASLPVLGAAFNGILETLDLDGDRARAWAWICRGLGRDPGAVGSLVTEMVRGGSPGPAAVGLAATGDPAAVSAIIRALQERGPRMCAPWLGPVLARLAVPDAVPVLVRMARSGHGPLESQAASAIGAFPPEAVEEVIPRLARSRDPQVRLNLLTSMGSLLDPDVGHRITRLSRAEDPDLLRVAAIRSLGRHDASIGQGVLESVLENEAPVRRAEALEAAVLWPSAVGVFLDHARHAARSSVERLQLAGLLSLTAWAPDEADAQVHEIFAQPASRRWFLATYALRYLRSSNGPALLMRLADRARGTDLEELALASLCRYLDDGPVLSFLLEHVQGDVRPTLVRGVLEEIARHVPLDQAASAAEQVRDLVARPGFAAHRPAAIVALGALGDDTDRPVMIEALAGAESGADQVLAGLEGLELLMCDPSHGDLRALEKHPDPRVVAAALVARFRLGDLSAIEAIGSPGVRSRLADERVDVIRDMLLSARCMGRVSRLARLVAAVTTWRSRSAAEAEGGETRESRLDVPTPRGDASRDLQDVLGGERPLLPSSRMPHIGEGRPAGRSTLLYQSLGRHHRGEGLVARRPGVVPALIAGIALVAFSAAMIRRPAPPPVPVRPAAVTAGSPGVWVARDRLDGPRLRTGETLRGTVRDPVVVYAGFLQNILTVRGVVRVEDLARAAGGPRDSRIALELETGELDLALTRGRSILQVTAGPVQVLVHSGRALLRVEGDRLLVRVTRGSVSVTDVLGDAVRVAEGRQLALVSGLVDGSVRPIGP